MPCPGPGNELTVCGTYQDFLYCDFAKDLGRVMLDYKRRSWYKSKGLAPQPTKPETLHLNGESPTASEEVSGLGVRVWGCENEKKRIVVNTLVGFDYHRGQYSPP